MEVVWEEINEFEEGFRIEKRGEGLFVVCLWDSAVCKNEFNLTEALKRIENGK